MDWVQISHVSRPPQTAPLEVGSGYVDQYGDFEFQLSDDDLDHIYAAWAAGNPASIGEWEFRAAAAPVGAV